MNVGRGSASSALARGIVLGAMSFAGAIAVSAPASAQFFGGWFGPRPMPIEREAVIPPRMVASIMHGQGFRLADYPVRRGDRIIALGIDERGQMMRFVLDAHDGAVIRASLAGAPRPPGFVGADRQTYAYGAPGFEPAPPIDAGPVAPKPKPKPKVKTAAKHPTPLPQAAPASPAAPPSQATQTPAPVEPSPVAPVPVAPPVATTPPIQPPAPVASAPPPTVRPAPDAQPGDIGPKVVPVKPTEARAPEPDSWDTEAQKAPAVTPEQANTMPPERHEDK